jgi:catechol 2,3-dioxygenase-like lactoylglutathione lyase family enzyme
MLSHVCVGITDYERAFEFYSALAEELGWRLKFADPAHHSAGWTAQNGARPLFFITRPANGAPPAPGNGTMTAFLAPSRDAVRLCYAVAIETGAKCEGPPGLRPPYHPDYYAAYFRDLDGNKLCVVCHDPARELEF